MGRSRQPRPLSRTSYTGDRIQTLRNRFNQEKGRKIQIESEIRDLDGELRAKTRLLDRYEKAREIIREVGLATQQQLQVHISDLVSLAMESVFEDPYSLLVEFVQRRNKTECDLLFYRAGQKLHPLDSSGFGVVDVASLALRIASWSMQVPHKRNTIILDEPFKFLDDQTDRIQKTSQMVKEMSDRLGLQFIIVTHDETLTEYADKVFEVRLRKGKSIVT